MQKFIARFEDTFDFLLANWDGNTDLFAQTTQKIVEEIFNLALLKNYTLNSEINNDALKNYVRPNTIAATVYTTILTLVKEQGFFKLSTIISLISEANRLEAKKILLDLIQAKIIILVGEQKENEIAIEEAIQNITNIESDRTE